MNRLPLLPSALVLSALLVGCQELPTGVIAGRDTGESPDQSAEFEDRLRRLEAVVEESKDELTPRDDSAELARLRSEVARLTRQLAESDRLLAEEFGRRAEHRTRVASGESPVVR